MTYRELATEIDRLTAALHAGRCHPDYTYVVTPPTAFYMRDLGYEPCPEVEVAPGDQCWRRRKDHQK